MPIDRSYIKELFLQQTETNAELHKWSVKELTVGCLSPTDTSKHNSYIYLSVEEGVGIPKARDQDVCCETVSSVYDRRVAFMNISMVV